MKARSTDRAKNCENAQEKEEYHGWDVEADCSDENEERYECLSRVFEPMQRYGVVLDH